MALRTSFKRLPLGVSTSPLAARSLTSTAAVRPSVLSLRSAAATKTASASRFFTNTSRSALEASAVVGDGGNTEPPEHGINVDKSMRMDALVFFYPYTRPAAGCYGSPVVAYMWRALSYWRLGRDGIGQVMWSP